MNRLTRILAALIATGLVAVASGRATFAAFSVTTQNPNDSYVAGNVSIADNDAGTLMWDVANQLPTSAAIVRCIRVTYTGSLVAGVRLYTTTRRVAARPVPEHHGGEGHHAGGDRLPELHGLHVARPRSLRPARWRRSRPRGPPGRTASRRSRARRPTWNPNDSLVYRFTLQVQNNVAAQGLTGMAGFTWEAQNQ